MDVENSRKAWLWNQRRLRELARAQGDDVSAFCGHDRVEFERLAGRPMDALPREGARPATISGEARPSP